MDAELKQLAELNDNLVYWKSRCLLAEKCLDEREIVNNTMDQIIADREYDSFLKATPEPT